MRMGHLILVLILAVGGMARAEGRPPSLDLGEPYAVQSSVPPYIFRLAFSLPNPPHPELPAVSIRRPRDVLSFVKDNILELRLQHLTDVEVDISYGGQTLNRLVLKAELEAAHARLETASKQGPRVPVATQPVPLASRPPQPTVPPEFPNAKRPAVVLQGEDRAGGPPAPAGASDRMARLTFDPELHLIRQEIHHLVGQVIPWGHPPPRPAREAEGMGAMIVAALFGGALAAGVTSLLTGYLMVRWARGHEQRQWRLAAGAMIGAGHQLPPAMPALPGRQPTARVRRVRVTHKVHRRIRGRPFDGAALLDAVTHLRQVQLHQQGRLSLAPPPERPDATAANGGR